MQVRQGWSGEYRPNQWGKADITLDEGDLVRILRDAGLEAAIDTISSTAVYRLLDIEAERLLLTKLMVRFGYPIEEGKTRLGELNTARTALLDQLHERLGP